MGYAGLLVALFAFVSCKASEQHTPLARAPETQPEPKASDEKTQPASAVDSSCTSDVDCQSIPTYCGGWNAVNRKAVASARAHYDKLGTIKNCREGSAPKPDAYCENSTCGPQVWNADGRFDLGKTVVLPASSYIGERSLAPYSLSADDQQEALKALETRLSQEKPSILDRSSNYRGQFIGVRRGPHESPTMYGNFFCGKTIAASSWTQVLVLVDDGGECYFEFEYDFRDKRITEFSINGDG